MMNVEALREICISLPHVTESFPFDDTTLVFKVGGKMFAYLDLSTSNNGIALKCDPEQAILLREEWEEVRPGYHMNKKHWNTIQPSARLTTEFMHRWIKHSYMLVFNKLPRATREVLNV